MQRLLRIVGRSVLVAVGVLVAVYLGEDVLLRYRANHGGTAAVFDNVTTYEAGAVKGGRQEFYFDQPQVEVCVRALFPHFGNAPCWYVRRHAVKVLSLNRPELWRLPQAVRSSKLDVIWIPGWSERYTGHLGAKMSWTRPMVSRLSSPAAITNAT